VSLISIDRAKCTHCGLCVRVCPVGVFVNLAEQAPPEAERADRCIRCGHCVAVCPHDALTHHGMVMEGFLPVPDVVAGADEMEALLLSKRSVRLFEDRPVAKETLERLLRIADAAPSARNARQREFVVVRGAEALRRMELAVARHYGRRLRWLNPVVLGALRLAAPGLGRMLHEAVPHLRELVRRIEQGETLLFRGAPCAVFIHGPRSDPMSRDDCLAAQHYLMLQAHSMGLGTCIIGYVTAAPVAAERWLRVPRGRRIYAATIIGHPAVRYRLLVGREGPRVTWM